MARRGLIDDVTMNPAFMLLQTLLVVMTTGLLIRDLRADEPNTVDVVVRILTVLCCLVLLVAGLVGRRRRRREPGAAVPAEETRRSTGPQA
ncbi:hypothetical protein [Modestobacter versicolor]|uniref:hypothetical protein n=1 Tax=Modestobacter versicolor TaxID=429133 RepID=UPI0034E00900